MELIRSIVFSVVMLQVALRHIGTRSIHLLNMIPRLIFWWARAGHHLIPLVIVFEVEVYRNNHAIIIE